MKKFISNIKTLAALLMAVAALAACSSDDNSVIDQPANPTETAPKTYTMTIQATKSSGDDAATTRGLYFNGTALNVKWYDGEVVEVYQGVKKKGTLTATASSNGSTTLTGEVSGLTEEEGNITFYLHSNDRDYSEQTGVLLKPETGTDNSIETKYDFAQCSVAYNDITIDGTTISIPGGIALESYQSIVKFILQDKDGNALNATKLTIDETQNNIYLYRNSFNLDIKGDLEITPGSATDVIYAALSIWGSNNGEFFLTAEANGKTYVYGPKKVTFEHGKYYEVTVKMQEENPKAIYLWRKDEAFTAQDGDILIGEAMDSYKISIDDGATVTLRNVTINANGYYKTDNYAGITCLGDATINLEGTNSVCGFDEHYPGIYVPVGKTLTIEGTGKLTAESNGVGAGIGGAVDLSCGNIIINSGTIVAEGGDACAAIGGGYNYNTASVTCGDITINGGDITATSWADAAAIGSGGDNNASCGDITITGGTVRATNATGGSGGAGIGSGSHGHCGDILISGGTIIASGGMGCPGIGSGSYGHSGDITITGGTVTATGGELAAGIGGGTFGECGTITIANTITRVEATHGGLGTYNGYTTPYSIGVGSDSNAYQENKDSNCGSIIFDNVTFTPTWQQGTDSGHPNSWFYSPEPASGTYGGLTLSISGNTWTLVPTP